MKTLIRQAVTMLALLSVLTGVLYPLAVWAIAQATMPGRANGSLLVKDGRLVGSELVGQPFTQDRYFWPRPSACGHDAASSGGSNLGPTNPALAAAVRARVEALVKADPAHRPAVPVDLVTASASGLDPEISPAGAEYQVARVAAARGWPEAKVRAVVAACARGRQWGLLGEPRVNVLALNLALDRAAR